MVTRTVAHEVVVEARQLGAIEATCGTRLSASLVNVLVPSYEIERRIPFFFKSWRAGERESYDFDMAQVVRAATAAADLRYLTAESSDSVVQETGD